jgi:cytosine/adenosine deaminase-related metal-dependent hydrolase
MQESASVQHSTFSRRALLGGGSAAAVAASVGWSSDRRGRAEEAPPSPGGHGRRSQRKLITGGYLLTMDGQLGDLPTGEVLIDGDRIVEVAAHVAASRAAGAETIDATGMIVMPGMIDNHRHMWESLIRGFAADLTFGEYFAQVLFGVSPRLTPDDVFLGNLLSAYESLDSGITTILDWSHGTNTPDHATSAIEGLRQSGSRAVFAYGSPAANSGRPDSPPTPDDVRAAHALLEGDPLVDLAVATSNPETSDFGRVAADIALARELGAGVTMHAFGSPRPSAPERLAAAGLMGENLTFVHGNSFTPGDFALIAEHGAHMSSSPEVEMQMGLGAAPLTGMLAGGVHPTVSVDIVPAVGGELFTQLRFLLQTQRMLDHQEAQRNGTPLTSLPVSTRDVLPYATTHAAASLGLGDRIGSLTPGKQADVIVVDALDLNLFLAEPGAALVSAAHPGNVDTVLVAGRIVKRAGQLVGVQLGPLRRDARVARRRLLG